MPTEKIYTQDWFDRRIPVWEEHLAGYKGVENLNFLEVGSYEGRSSCWLMDNILTHPSSRLICLDFFEGCLGCGEWSEELYQRYDMPEVLRNFRHNTKEYGGQVECRVGMSQELLRDYGHKEQFDLVYIDGSHIASDVLEDVILSFRLLKIGGTMILDDYTWEFFDDPRRHPKMAIDAFLSVFEGQYDLLLKDCQVILRKIGKEEKEGKGRR